MCCLHRECHCHSKLLPLVQIAGCCTCRHQTKSTGAKQLPLPNHLSCNSCARIAQRLCSKSLHGCHHELLQMVMSLCHSLMSFTICPLQNVYSLLEDSQSSACTLYLDEPRRPTDNVASVVMLFPFRKILQVLLAFSLAIRMKLPSS